jgi:SAM-dependent methyltransferase
MSDYRELAAYYARLGGAGEEDYRQPEHQADLAILHERVPEALRGHRVIELACGTGYWTGLIAETAASVLATDIDPRMIEAARSARRPGKAVEFAVADAFDLKPAIGKDASFSACFAGSWWSHIKRQDQGAFLAQLRGLLGKDALLVLVDSVQLEGSSTPIARTDAEGNTYQIRTLPDGGRVEIPKNFPSDSALRKKLGASVRDIRILRLEHYWMLTGRLK